MEITTTTYCTGNLATKSDELDLLMASRITQTNEDLRHSNPNPLLIDLILTRILEYLDHVSLKYARMVCSTWEEIAFPIFQRKGVINLHLDQIRTDVEFCNVFGQALQCGRVFTSLQCPVPYQIESSRIITKWLQLHGSSIESLTLTCPPPEGDQEEFIKRVDESYYAIDSSLLCDFICCFCPNLKTLQIPVPELSDYSSTLLHTRSTLLHYRSIGHQHKGSKKLNWGLESVALGCNFAALFPQMGMADVAFRILRCKKHIGSLKITIGAYQHHGSIPLGYHIQADDGYSCMYSSQRYLSTTLLVKQLDIGSCILPATWLQNLYGIDWRNLQKLRIGVDTVTDCSPPLQSFIDRYGPQLDTLILVGMKCLLKPLGVGSDLEWPAPDIRYPGMPFKQHYLPCAVLSYLNSEHIPTKRWTNMKTLSIDVSSLESKAINIIRHTPNLTRLILHSRDWEDETVNITDRVLGTDTPLRLSGFNLDKLETLDLFCTIDSETVDTILECCPNIQQLFLSMLEEEGILPRFFNSLGTLSKLRKLGIYISPINYLWTGHSSNPQFSTLSAESVDKFLFLKQLTFIISLGENVGRGSELKEPVLDRDLLCENIRKNVKQSLGDSIFKRVNLYVLNLNKSWLKHRIQSLGAGQP